MRWSWYGTRSLYGRPGLTKHSRWGSTIRTYPCRHVVPDLGHRTWGENFEQPWLSDAWMNGFNAAHRRMVEEAAAAGAHGVLGVVDTTSHLVDNAILEFHLYGTAVVVEDAPPPEAIWSTYVAGQRLAKLLESGFMPVSVIASVASVRMWAVCSTDLLMNGRWDMGIVRPGSRITQFADAQMDARRFARDHLRSHLDGDGVQGATLEVDAHEIAKGDTEVRCILRGNRTRQFKTADALPPPQPTVRLS